MKDCGFETPIWERIPVSAEHVLDLVPDFVGVAAPDGRLLFVNGAGRKMIGVGAEEDVSAFLLHDFFPAWSVGTFEPPGYGGRAGASVDWNPRGRLRTRAGHEVPAAHVVVAHTDAESEISCFTVIARGAFWPEDNGAAVQRFDLEEVLGESLAMARASLDPSVVIVQSFESDSAAVLADPTQIHRLVMDLCLNSAQSMRGDGGEIFVNTSRVVIQGPDEPGGTALRAGSYVRLTIRDNGPGIAPAMAPHVFEPAAAGGRGTGFSEFGLWNVRRSVIDSGGDIFVETAPGRGTAFHVYLPIVGTNGSGSLP